VRRPHQLGAAPSHLARRARVGGELRNRARERAGVAAWDDDPAAAFADGSAWPGRSLTIAGMPHASVSNSFSGFKPVDERPSGFVVGINPAIAPATRPGISS
jgi:hypothetical protein